MIKKKKDKPEREYSERQRRSKCASKSALTCVDFLLNTHEKSPSVSCTSS